jgi:hypothetical protein
MNTNSLAFRVCLDLGLHPGSSLTLSEIADRWDTDKPHAWQALETAVSGWWLEKLNEVRPDRRGHKCPIAVYRAGPELLKLLEDK